MSGYTPGPWEWVENKFRGGLSGIVGANGKEVLFPNHCNDGDDGDAWFEDFPNEADRALITAAPELLAIAKGLVITLTGAARLLVKKNIGLELMDDISQCLAAADEIIAKAEGVET